MGMGDRKEEGGEGGRRGGAGMQWTDREGGGEEGGECPGSFFSMLRPGRAVGPLPVHNDTELICSAGPQSCAGVHHYVHQRGVEEPLQPCGGAQGGCLRHGSLVGESESNAHHNGSGTFAFLSPLPSPGGHLLILWISAQTLLLQGSPF